MRNLVGCVAVAVFALGATRTGHAGAAEGKELYEKQCKICHSIGDEKGKMANNGGPLDGVGTKRDAGWLKGFLQDPKSKNPDGKMPKPKISEQQIDDLVAFLLTLK